MIDITQEILDDLPKPNRVMAPFRWFGGKGQLAKWILPQIPTSKIYVEPYAGAASIFWHKEPSPVEVLNDLHSEIVSLYRVLQDKDKFDQLKHKLAWTLYSREEFRLALDLEHANDIDDVTRAWAFFVRQNQGFSGTATCEGNWSRAFTSSRNMAENASKWRVRLSTLQWWHERIGRVQIDNVDAIKCIKYWDGGDTTFYVDPPYVMDTRKCAAYKHEVDDGHHRQLVETLLSIKGQAVLSGYNHPIYEPLTEAGWTVAKLDTASYAAGKGRNSGLQGKGAAIDKVPRTEVLWIKRRESEGTLF